MWLRQPGAPMTERERPTWYHVSSHGEAILITATHWYDARILVRRYLKADPAPDSVKPWDGTIVKGTAVTVLSVKGKKLVVEHMLRVPVVELF